MAERLWNRGLQVTMPLVIAGAMTVSMNLTAPVESASAAPKKPTKPKTLARTVVTAAPAVAAVHTGTLPATHTVVSGDSVSGIASHYGLSTASVLAINGLGWKTVIHPGQVLKLSSAAGVSTPSAPSPTVAVAGGRYAIQKGDTISAIAARFGVTTQAILSANGLGWSSIIYPGQSLAIPGSDMQSVAASTPVSAPAAPAPAPAPAAPAAGSTYTIHTGDTVSRIASRFGVSVGAVLSANGLSAGSVIYAGRALTIPGASLAAVPAASVTAVAVTPLPVYAQDGSTVTPLDAEMATNAAVIVSVGRQLGVSDRGIVIALAAAMQESSLRNIPYGDRDSVGLFQQRPAAGWGAKESLLDPAHSARLFYGGPSNPNKGFTRGLLEIPGWQSMSLTQAAQAVQISAYPSAYAKWEKSAWAWLAALS